METSPFYSGWVDHNEKDIAPARQAILERDLEALGQIMERSALRMHASMLGANPPVRYWKSQSVWAMDAVENLRKQGIGAWWTMDAGPNEFSARRRMPGYSGRQCRRCDKCASGRTGLGRAEPMQVSLLASFSSLANTPS